MINHIIQFFLHNRLVTLLLLLVFIIWGTISSPFEWNTGFLPRDPVPVDAIPDIGENQQIVYTQWPGQSPQDIDDQISYPLTTALLGISGVKTIRSNAIFGVSSIYIIFDESVDFYWSRTRILEKLNSLPSGTLPEGVTPSLGPDATALGQVFWYTLEGRDAEGKPSGGWDPQELRSIQDFYVKYGLTSAKGVAEVASIGGYVKEYQVDIDPAAMQGHHVTIAQIIQAVKNSNLDIGARTLEYNRAEYLIRSLGYIKNPDDLRNSVVTVRENTPIYLRDVAQVHYGPAARRGGLDKGSTDAVGGVVVARYGANPLEVINHVKEKIERLSTGLPSRTLDDGTISKVTIVPFYDRSGLINETLGTLEEALTLEVLISIVVVLILIFNLRASILISSLLPIGVLMTFILMRHFGVDANIVALSGIAIAIGVMVDVGVVFTENIIRHIKQPPAKEIESPPLIKTIEKAAIEVAPAVLTAISTTIVSFLPVFFMEYAEGKLFKPLAFTKTFAMLSALVIGMTIIPTMAWFIFSLRVNGKKIRYFLNIALVPAGSGLIIMGHTFSGIIIILWAIISFTVIYWPKKYQKFYNPLRIALILLLVTKLLAHEWMPLGAQNSMTENLIFTTLIIAVILGTLMSVIFLYRRLLSWALAHKLTFLSIPVLVILLGIMAWQGVEKTLGFLPNTIKQTNLWQQSTALFPGIGKEFMPSLDEGSFLLMPTTMPHSGVEENLEVIRLLDKNINAIPEVENVIGKWGRVNSALDPAPVSMYENIINYKSEYVLNKKGHKTRFAVDDNGAFKLKDGTTYHPGEEPYRGIDTALLIHDAHGEYFRQWRNEIKSPDDIWDAIIRSATIPGLTSAPKLQPIQTRLVMLQTGMRAPMGIKIYGPDLNTIEHVGLQIEQYLKNAEGVEPSSVFADRVVGKPYLEIKINRESIARYGLTIKALQKHISSAIGGIPLTYTVEGRERYPVRVRYAREYRDNPTDLMKILISTPTGNQVPLGDLASLEYTQGPQMIKSEDTFLVSYVIFDKKQGYAEVDVVNNAQKELNKQITQGNIMIPAGVSYKFTGNYENQVRATQRLLIIIPLSLLIIFLILYFQFRSATSAALIFSGILVAFSGGFIMLWLYGQPWFMHFSIGDTPMRDLFQIAPINLSVAVWVGFIALFGIATDDGVLISTYLKQLFDQHPPNSLQEVRNLVMEAGMKRVRPAMMTTATTILALLPVLTSTGKGSDIMIPMAIPAVGGMLIAILSIFVVPVLYSMWQEHRIKNNPSGKGGSL